MTLGIKSALTALAVLAAAPATAQMVFNNASNGAACAPSCWTATFGTDGSGGYQAFDDFVLTSASAVSWTGFYIDYINTQNNPVAPPTTSWQIAFYANASGEPGSQAYLTSLPAGDVHADFLGDGSAFGSSVSFYQFTAVLPTAFDASGGTTYWFSPESVQPDFDPFFSWSASNASDPYGTWQVGLGGIGTGHLLSQSDDVARAFTLSDSVPEPASWALTILGIGGVGGAVRISRRRTGLAIARVRSPGRGI